MGCVGPRRPGGLAIRGLVTAVRFLTVVPVPGRGLEGPDALGRVAGWFPVVGLALGGLLAVEERLLSFLFPPLLSALGVLATWKVLTGGIHLDGLADSLDGLSGGNPEERLAIMRDSRVGAFATVGVIFLLLLAFAALAELRGALRLQALLLAPPVGRLAPLLLACVVAPATSREGAGAAFMTVVTRGALVFGGGFVAVVGGIIGGRWGIVAAAVGLAVAWGGARFFSRRLGGLTGDGLGAGVELAELGVLLAFAAFSQLRFI